MHQLSQNVYVGQWDRPIVVLEIGEPLLSHVVVALVVEFFAGFAKFYNFGCSLNLVSFNQ